MYDVWETTGNKEISEDGNGSRMINVAVYARVSTRHEEQVKALDNQIAWLDDMLKYHPNWRLVKSSHSSRSKRSINKEEMRTIEGFYIDEGLSGLTAERPSFNQLINDAKAGKIDLIITREVCRFSRNIVDTFSISRELKSREYGVGIYFISDAIFSYQKDAELKLGIYSTFAQSESQKISDRVRAGQETSRQKNQLYGNGNILGYDLVRQTGSNRYVINDDQAETVKRIFDLCEEGYGISKISHMLVNEKRKNSSGEIKWNNQNILRILRSKVYCGYLSYNVSKKENCIEKKRINLGRSKREFKKVSEDIIPPIINEELWNACQNSLDKKSEEYFHPKTSAGKKTSAKDVFAKKLRCSCGSSFRRNIWYRGKNGNTHGYTCYNVLNNGRADRYKDKELAKSLNMCNMPAISEIKLKVQAFKVFSGLLDYKKLIDDVTDAASKTNNKKEKNIQDKIKANSKMINKLRERTKKFINMYADDLITKDDFINHKAETEENIQILQEENEALNNQLNKENKPEPDKELFRNVLCEILDCEKDVNAELIDRFVYRIIVDSPTRFIWQLHFKPINNEAPVFVPMYEHRIDAEYAKMFADKNNQNLHKKQWQDITVEVQIAI